MVFNQEIGSKSPEELLEASNARRLSRISRRCARVFANAEPGAQARARGLELG